LSILLAGPTEAPEPSEVLGRTTPRIFTQPLVTGPPGPCGCGCALDEATSEGFAVDGFAREVLKRPLDPWERWLVIHGMERLPNGWPRFRQLLILVARQNGKTHVLVVLSLYWLWRSSNRIDPFLVLGTSTKLDMAQEPWKKAVRIARATPDLAKDIAYRGAVRQANGEQTIETPWAARYKIAAANEEGGRSLTINRLIEDEIRQHHNYSAHEAADNAMNAVDDGQAWAISNEGDVRSIVLHDLYESGLRFITDGEGDGRLGLFAWSAEPGCDLLDVEQTAQANPNLGRRISWENLKGKAERAKQAGGEQEAHYRTEILCQYVHHLEGGGVTMDNWAQTAKHAEKDDLGPPVFFVTIGKDLQSASIALAADHYGIPYVELCDHRQGVSWVTARIRELLDRYPDSIVGAFAAGPMRSWVPSLSEFEVDLELFNTPETISACAHLQKLSETLGFTHEPDQFTTDSLRNAERRSLDGGAWVWDWKSSRGDLSPIAAVTGALWLLESNEPADLWAFEE